MLLIIQTVVAALVAGIAMALTSELGFRLGAFRSSLIAIDGQFVSRFLGRSSPQGLTCPIGTVVHLATSAAFGVTYAIVVALLGWSQHNGLLVSGYVFFLWMAMLAVALPIAGQGTLGAKAGKLTWLEQAILHAVFGLIFWIALKAF
jgi:hypothetical protein